MEQWVILAVAAIIGAVFGSFLTMFTYRYPREMPLALPRSRCGACEHVLGVRDLFPIFSWAFSGGKCRYCRASVSIRYPLIELVCAAGFVGIIWLYGLSVLALPVLVLYLGVVALIVTDLEHWIIPDPVHLFLIPAGLFYGYALGDIMPHLVGMGAGLLIGLTLHYGYKWLRKRDGLGLGDVKFLATAGAWLGLVGMVPFLFFSGLLGIGFALLWRQFSAEKTYFPFGPALAITLLLSVLFPEIPQGFWVMLAGLKA